MGVGSTLCAASHATSTPSLSRKNKNLDQQADFLLSMVSEIKQKVKESSKK